MPMLWVSPFSFCCYLYQDKSATSSLKIEALVFTRLVLASHSPSVFHPYIKVIVPHFSSVGTFLRKGKCMYGGAS